MVGLTGGTLGLMTPQGVIRPRVPRAAAPAAGSWGGLQLWLEFCFVRHFSKYLFTVLALCVAGDWIQSPPCLAIMYEYLVLLGVQQLRSSASCSFNYEGKSKTITNAINYKFGLCPRLASMHMFKQLLSSGRAMTSQVDPIWARSNPSYEIQE